MQPRPVPEPEHVITNSGKPQAAPKSRKSARKRSASMPIVQPPGGWHDAHTNDVVHDPDPVYDPFQETTASTAVEEAIVNTAKDVPTSTRQSTRRSSKQSELINDCPANVSVVQPTRKRSRPQRYMTK
jgi:hypothetical protein